MNRYMRTLLMVAAIINSACQKRDIEPLKNNTVTTLSVNVDVKSNTKSPVTGKWFDHGTKINIMLLDKEATTAYNGIMQSYILDRQDITAAGAWASVVTPGLILNRDVAKVHACYPVSAILSADKTKIKLDDTQIMDLGKMNASSTYNPFYMALNTTKPTEVTEVYAANQDMDYMTGVGTDVSTVPPNVANTTITMKHARAMVIVKLTKDPLYMGDENLVGIEIRNNENNVATPLVKGEMKIEDNSFVPSVPTQTRYYRRSMTNFPVGAHFAILVNEASATANDVLLVLKIGKITYTLKLSSLWWKPGMVYVYNVNMTPNGVLLDGQVKVLDWLDAIKHKVELD